MRILNVIASLDPAGDENAASAIRLTEIWRRVGHIVSSATGIESAESHDVIVIHGARGFPAVAARRALVGSPIPYFVLAPGKRADDIGWRRVDGKVANGAAAVLFETGEAALGSLGAFHPWRVRSRIVGFGSEEPPPGELRQRGTFLAAHPALMNRRMLLFHGRLHAEDGCIALIDSLARQALAHPDLDLVLAGPDEPARRTEIFNRANALGLADRVHWAGAIDGEVKWGACRQADALILPSRSQRAETIVAESLACGLPVLITDRIAVWREVDRCGAGLVAPDALLDRYLAMSHTQRHTMRLAARTCFERHFRYETVAARMIGAFREGLRSSTAA